MGYLQNINLPILDDLILDDFKTLFYLTVIGFGLGFLFLLFYRSVVQKLNISTIFTGTIFRWKLFFLGMGIASLIILGSLLFSQFYLKENEFQPAIDFFKSMKPEDYIKNLLLMAFIFCFQASFEEMFFRGVLVQNLRRLKIPLFLCVILSSVLFGFAHAGQNISYHIIIATGLMGLTFSMATIRTNGIEVAMGAHIINNFIVGAILNQLDNTKNDETYLVGLVFLGVFLVLLEIGLRVWPRLIGSRAELFRS